MRSDIERYLAMQFADDARAASVNRRLSLRRFTDGDWKPGAIAGNPCDLVDAPLGAIFAKDTVRAAGQALLAAPDTATAFGDAMPRCWKRACNRLRVSELVG